jgi:hypothetical protein
VLQDGAGAENINDFMRGYDRYGGLALNWVVFGSSGHKQRPHGGVLVNYRQCLPLQQEQNQHVKVIANTAHLMTVGDDPHRVYYNDMKRLSTVNELGAPVRCVLLLVAADTGCEDAHGLRGGCVRIWELLSLVL